MVELAPFLEVAPVAIEQLDAVVLAIGDEDAVAPVDPDRVRRGELAGAGAGRSS